MSFTVFGNRDIGSPNVSSNPFFDFCPRPAGGFFAAHSSIVNFTGKIERYVRAFGSNGEPVAASVLIDNAENAVYSDVTGPIKIKELIGGRCVIAWVTQDGNKSLNFRVCDSNGATISSIITVNPPGFFTPIGGVAAQPAPDNLSRCFDIIQNGTGFSIIWVNSIYTDHVNDGITNSSSAFIRKFDVDGNPISANIGLDILGNLDSSLFGTIEILATSHSSGYGIASILIEYSTFTPRVYFTGFDNTDVPLGLAVDIDELNSPSTHISNIIYDGTDYIIDVDTNTGESYKRTVAPNGILGDRTSYPFGRPLPDNSRYQLIFDFTPTSNALLRRYSPTNVLESSQQDFTIEPSNPPHKFIDGKIITGGIDISTITEFGCSTGYFGALHVISQYTPLPLGTPLPSSSRKIIWFS